MKNYRILALILALFVLTAALSGCAGNGKTAAVKNDSYSYEEPMAAPAITEEAKAEGSYDWAMEAPDEEVEFLVTSGTGGEPVAYDQSVADFTAKIIYSAYISMQSTEFDKSVAALDQMIASMDGFVESSNIYGNTCYNDDGTTRVVDRCAYYTARIPAKNFEQFLKQTAGIGNVISTSRDAENVTSQYTDYEARLSSLKTQEERLLAMLEKADDVDTLVALEERLCDVRYEIESIERNLRNLDMRISYSTVTIEMQEVEIYTPTVPVTRTFGEKLSDAFSDGWHSFTRSFQYFFLDLAEALPGLVLFVFFVIVIFFVVRRIVKKTKAKKAAKADQKPVAAKAPAAPAAQKPAAPAPEKKED